MKATAVFEASMTAPVQNISDASVTQLNARGIAAVAVPVPPDAAESAPGEGAPAEGQAPADADPALSDPAHSGAGLAAAAAAYCEHRVKPQLATCVSTARRARVWHLLALGMQLFVAALIPIVNVMHFYEGIISTVLAGVVALAHGSEQIFRHHETWLLNKQTANALHDLQIRYQLGVPPFDGADRHNRFIQEADRILGQESAKAMALASDASAPAVSSGGGS